MRMQNTKKHSFTTIALYYSKLFRSKHITLFFFGGNGRTIITQNTILFSNPIRFPMDHYPLLSDEKNMLFQRVQQICYELIVVGLDELLALQIELRRPP